MNGLLGVKPLPIADEELELPRASRVILAQLRSGLQQIKLLSLSRIDLDIPYIYPACNDFKHLFACKMHHTHLKTLWLDPIETARLLGLPLDDFVDNQPNPYHSSGN